MKIALIPDLHIGCRNDSPFFHDYMKRGLEWFFKIVDEQNIQQIIQLGDLVDRRKYINFLSAKFLRENFLQPISNRNIKTHIICGNHDVFYKSTNKVNALEELIGEGYKHVNVYTDPKEVNIMGTPFLMMPWINAENMNDCVKAINETKADIMIGHLELVGFEMHKGIVSDQGQDAALFDKFDMVLTGHYHHISSKKNINYLGAFCEMTWADWNDPRGFWILDLSTRKLEFFENPYKIFHVIHYDDKGKIDYLKKFNLEECKDKFVKIIIHTKDNPFIFDKLIEGVNKSEPIDVSIVENTESFLNNDEKILIDAAQDTMSILDTYIGGLTLSVDNNKMKHYMREVYKEALSLEHVD